MRDNNIAYTPQEGVGTVVYVARGDKFIGSLLISDEIKSEAKSVVSALNDMNCNTVMLTGDNEVIAKSVAQDLGLTSYKASLLPHKNKGDVLCFVGDGINDAPVLMRSDIGIAMGGVGSDAAIEASDIVLMQDDLRGIATAKRIAKKTMSVVMQNIVISLAVKLLIMLLSALGITGMWLAVIGDVGVAIVAILNAMRVNKNYDTDMAKKKKALKSKY